MGIIWVKCDFQSLPYSHRRYVHQRWTGLSNKGRLDGSMSYWIGWISGLLYTQKSQAKVICFTVLLSPFSEKAFGLTLHSASFPWWVAADKLLVSIFGPQRLEPYLPFIPACVSFLIAAFLSIFLFLWWIVAEAREFGEGWPSARAITCSGSFNGAACFSVPSALLFPWLTKDPSLW